MAVQHMHEMSLQPQNEKQVCKETSGLYLSKLCVVCEYFVKVTC